MSKTIPHIKKYMTADVQTIGDEQPMAVAHRLMREQHIRHLPVLHQGKLVGVVSDRDLRLIETLQDVDPSKVTVSEAMTPDPTSSVPKRRSTKWWRRWPRRIRLSGDPRQRKVVGIFTTVDACSAFAELLTTRLSH